MSRSMPRLSRSPAAMSLAAIAASVWLAATVRADEPSVQPAPAAPAAAVASAPAPDFSQGFTLLHRLGLTNVAQTAYVTLTVPPNPYQTRMPAFCQIAHRYGLTGNAWQLSGDATNGLFLMGETTLVRAFAAPAAAADDAKDDEDDEDADATDAADWDGDMYDGYGPFAGAASSTPWMLTARRAQWKPADLQADLAILLPKLQKAADKAAAAARKAAEESDEDDDPRVRMRAMHSSMPDDRNLWVALFLRAAHCADQGRQAEANRIAELAMAAVGDRQTLLEAVMERLGNEAVPPVWNRFCQSGDWAAYAAELDALAARFPRGWTDAAGARDLARRLRDFAASGAKAAPLPAAAGLPAEQRALADRLALAPPDVQADRLYVQPGLWVLPAQVPTKPDPYGRVTHADWIATNQHPLAQLVRQGTNSIPLLLAMLEDRTTFTRLVAYGLTVEPQVVDAEALMQSGAFDVDAYVNQMQMSGHAGLMRPALRAEVAESLLKALVGTPQRVYSRRGVPASGEALAGRVRAWQERYVGLGPEDLAVALLRHEDSSLRSRAVQFLSAGSSTSGWQRLEQHLLTSTDGMDGWQAQEYVRQRGRDAKPFVDAFEARLTGKSDAATATATGEDESDPELFKAGGDYRVRERQRLVKEMRKIVDALPLDVLVDRIATGARPFDSATAQELVRQTWERPCSETLRILVEGAARAPSPEVRTDLLKRLPRASNLVQWRRHARGRPDVTDTNVNAAPVALATAWRVLLADARTPTNEVPRLWTDALSVQQNAAIALEVVYGPAGREEGPENPVMVFNKQTVAGLDLLARRAASRLTGASGEAVQPPLPDPARVPPARLLALTNELPRAPEATRIAQVAALNADERLALADAIAANPDLAPAFAGLAHRMRAVVPATAAPGVQAALQACDGRVMDVAALQALALRCSELARQGQPVTFVALRRPGFGGVDVTARAPQAGDRFATDTQPGVKISLETLLGAPDSLLCQPGVKVAAAAPPAAAAFDPLKRPTDTELLDEEIARLQRGPLSAADAAAAFWKRIAAVCSADPEVGYPAGVHIVAVGK